ncbi:MAG: hypothetical protein ACT4QF_15190 [Sporichthyaceae bacterium]
MSADLLLVIALAAGVLAMVLFIALNGRKTRNTISREHAERIGQEGAEGLRRAQARHDEHG